MAQTWRVARTASHRNRPPLDEDGLRALALGYLGRFATTRAKLRDYLRRKLAERGWAGARPADLDALVEAMATLGYVDDRAFAAARTAALARRGYGARRQGQALRAAGVEAEDAAAVRAEREEAGDDGRDAALAFARRKRIGPFAEVPVDPDRRRRQAAAMLRAGHPPALVRAIVATAPGAPFEDS